MFARRHYEIIARTLREERNRIPAGQPIAYWAAVVEALADTFARDNPRFDRGRFTAACHKES